MVSFSNCKGRRRFGSFLPWLCWTLSLITVVSVNAAVMSVDLGSEWMKVAVVDLKPGQSPISIALNEMSKRKSPVLVAFQGGNRLVGEEAAGIMARYPEKVYALVRDMVGKPFASVKKFAEANYLPYDLHEDSKGSAVFRTDDNQNITAETLLAMILDYGRSLAEAHSKGFVKDAVFSVPPYMGQAERQSIVNAAQIAGITVLSLMNEHSGAALQYGIDKDFSNESRDVLFYDMGANSVYAAVIHFSAYAAKERGKNVTYNHFQVKGVRSDPSLGGQTLEMRLVEHFADEFNKQIGGGVDVKQFPKAMAKLKKQAKRTKEILSANTEAPFFVDALYDDRDFKSKITREKFEEICADLFQRAALPLKSVLTDVGITADGLYAVELVGGATRVPKLQQVLSEVLGKKILERHLDADEAVALGGALHAANLSDGIKLNRKLGMADGASYGISMKVELLKDSEDFANVDKQVLVQRLKKLPSKFSRSLTDDKDFKLTVFYDPEDELPPGILSPEIAVYIVPGVTDVHTKYASYNLSAPIKTNLHFSLSRSCLLSLDRVEAVIEIMEWVEVPVKESSENATSSPSITIENNTTSQGEVLKTPGESGEEGIPLTADGLNNTSTSNDTEVESLDAPKPLVKKKLRKRILRVPLRFEDAKPGVGKPLSEEELVTLRSFMEKLRLVDAKKRETAEAKNSLESYIYATKDKLDSLEDIEKVSTEELRETLRHEFSEAEDWLYTDGEEASAEAFKERLEALQAIGDPIFSRLKELKERPLAITNARNYLDDVKTTISEWESQKPWIGEVAKEDLAKEADAIKQWLEQKEIEQAERVGHLEPVITSDEIYFKILKLRDLVLKISRTPKPKPKPVEKPVSNSSNETSYPDPPKDESEPVEDTSTPKDDTSQEDIAEEEPSYTAESDKVEDNHDEL
ncbi:hypothetical protein O6H91_18G055500 [Diphasiastrum complanatum]|uniref:Uncharacterized protein n=2 Tax=Diphasiastrum complanatum TaxID=34168 RepID=A0ACC2B1A6_DIPCM|nr:hypothetical protein O6H91_18G055500 [Diphasiastrum complanatum]KAJ7523588.1 hypothetical protein O6H91_18G055500 [Diphasiastrum complanatum]